jgi:hypothetical protein
MLLYKLGETVVKMGAVSSQPDVLALSLVCLLNHYYNEGQG